MQTIDRKLGAPAEVSAIAGGGLRDTTRIAAGDTEIWKQIFAENGPALLDALDAYMTVLKEWRAALNAGEPDPEALGRLWAEGRAAREMLQFPVPNSE